MSRYSWLFVLSILLVSSAQESFAQHMPTAKAVILTVNDQERFNGPVTMLTDSNITLSDSITIRAEAIDLIKFTFKGVLLKDDIEGSLSLWHAFKQRMEVRFPDLTFGAPIPKKTYGKPFATLMLRDGAEKGSVFALTDSSITLHAETGTTYTVSEITYISFLENGESIKAVINGQPGNWQAWIARLLKKYDPLPIYRPGSGSEWALVSVPAPPFVRDRRWPRPFALRLELGFPTRNIRSALEKEFIRQNLDASIYHPGFLFFSGWTEEFPKASTTGIPFSLVAEYRFHEHWSTGISLQYGLSYLIQGIGEDTMGYFLDLKYRQSALGAHAAFHDRALRIGTGMMLHRQGMTGIQPVYTYSPISVTPTPWGVISSERDPSGQLEERNISYQLGLRASVGIEIPARPSTVYFNALCHYDYLMPLGKGNFGPYTLITYTGDTINGDFEHGPDKVIEQTHLKFHYFTLSFGMGIRLGKLSAPTTPKGRRNRQQLKK